MTTLRLLDDQLKALRMISAREGQSMNAILRELVEAFLEDYFDNLAADKALAEQDKGEWTDLDELMDAVRPKASG
ncbi:MAG: ribbon-helix-helix protein, CopG family [Fidelibacterota bacterium]